MRSTAAWRLARRQHDVVARRQLLALGFTRDAIAHRLKTGRLHQLWPGIYAVGTPHVSRLGLWMAAVLACGKGAVLSHGSAAALWRVGAQEGTTIHVSVPVKRGPRLRGIRVHRRRNLRATDITERQRIPVTAPAATLVDIAPSLPRIELEEAISQAAIGGVMEPNELTAAVDEMPPRPGVGRLKSVLERYTFRVTRSRLERLFLPLAHRAGLPRPLTRQWVNGFEVDFYWPDLGLVVEADSLRYHRSAGRQAKDLRRDRAHIAAGLTPLRFTHGEIRYEPANVVETLAHVAKRLAKRAA